MSQDTNLTDLIINKLTKEQYEGIATPNPNQLYFITDDNGISSLSDVNVSSPTNGQALTYNSTSQKWVNSTIDALPSQTSQSGKFLTTNGTTASWAAIPTEIPSQSGNSGKFLTTNGSAVSWASVDALPSQSGNSGKFLTTNGTTASWSGMAMSSLSDTNISSVSDGQILTYNSSSQKWVNSSHVSATFRDWSVS